MSSASSKRTRRYAGHVDSFEVPPDDEMLPAKIDVGQWVWTVWEECPDVPIRGLITNRHKRRTRSRRTSVVYEVRCLDNGTPADYHLPRNRLCLTKAEAEEECARAVAAAGEGGQDDSAGEEWRPDDD